MLQRVTFPRIMQTTASASDNLPGLLRRFGYRVPLLVTDRVTAELGIAEPFCQRLDQHQILYDLFSDLEAEASIHAVVAGTHKVLAGCSGLYPDPFDCMVALGGTSVMDVAKAISVAATHGGSLQHALQQGGTSLPVIAIPTTDSISEITGQTTLLDNGHHITINNIPVAILLDSELIGNMTPLISRATALSTLSYAVEAFASPSASLFSNQQALASLRLLRHNIDAMIVQPHNIDGRQAMTMAASLAGVAFNSTGGTLLHHMSHALSVTFDIEQPISRAMLFAPVAQYQSIITPAPYAVCATTLGLTCLEQSKFDSAQSLVRYINALYKNARFPGISAFVSDQSRYRVQIDTMARGVCAAVTEDNQAASHSPEEIRRLYQNLWCR